MLSVELAGALDDKDKIFHCLIFSCLPDTKYCYFSIYDIHKSFFYVY